MTAVASGTMLNPLNSSMISLALHSIQHEFHLSFTTVSWLISSFIWPARWRSLLPGSSVICSAGRSCFDRASACCRLGGRRAVCADFYDFADHAAFSIDRKQRDISVRRRIDPFKYTGEAGFGAGRPVNLCISHDGARSDSRRFSDRLGRVAGNLFVNLPFIILSFFSECICFRKMKTRDRRLERRAPPA